MKNKHITTTNLINKQLAKWHNRLCNNEITIKEYLVNQSDVTMGEFDVTHIANKPDDLAIENSETLLERMLSHVKSICMHAVDSHTLENFDNHTPNCINSNSQPKNVNAITRVTFSEFSFYPLSARGALTIDEFHVLCKMLLETANDYPINLHICLSSIPVVDQNKNVFNVTTYLQCGSNPQINVFAKACPSDVDPQYPDTTNPYYAKIEALNQLAIKFRKDVLSFEFLLRSKDLQAIKVAVENLLATMKARPRYLLTSDGIPYQEVLRIEEICNNILAHTTDDETFKKIDCLSTSIELINTVIEYTEEFEFSRGADARELTKLINEISIPQATLASNQQSGFSLYRGGLVECTTAGGAKFITGIDVCLDNDYNFAARLYERYLENCLREGTIISPYFSHIITSNSISVSTDEQPGNVVVHCDVKNSSIRDKHADTETLLPEKSITVNDTAFGSYALIECYNPYTLKSIQGLYRSRIEYYNKMIRDRLSVSLLHHHSANLDTKNVLDAFDQCSSLHTMQPTCFRRFILELILPTIYLKDSTVNNDAIKSAVEKHNDINAFIMGNTLLHWAIIHGLTDIAEFALQNKNIDLHLKNEHGYTAFDLAIMYNRTTTAGKLYQSLLVKGERTTTVDAVADASPETKTNILSIAVSAKQTLDVKYLLANGADYFYKDNHTTHTQAKLSKLSPEIFEVLYDHAVSTDQLHYLTEQTIDYGNPRLAILLLELCCRDKLEENVNYLLQQSRFFVPTLSEIDRLLSIINKNDGTGIYNLVEMHLIKQGYGNYIKEAEKKLIPLQVNSFRPFSPMGQN